jgi:hypothetical protein
MLSFVLISTGARKSVLFGMRLHAIACFRMLHHDGHPALNGSYCKCVPHMGFVASNP